MGSRFLSDGLSGGLPQPLGVGDSPSFQNLTLNGDLEAQNGSFSGTLEVSTLVTDIKVDDSLIELAINNPSDLINSGFFSKYVDGVSKYAGLIRSPQDGNFYLLDSDSLITPSLNITTLDRANLILNRITADDILVDVVTINNSVPANQFTMPLTRGLAGQHITSGGDGSTSWSGSGNEFSTLIIDDAPDAIITMKNGGVDRNFIKSGVDFVIADASNVEKFRLTQDGNCILNGSLTAGSFLTVEGSLNAGMFVVRGVGGQTATIDFITATSAQDAIRLGQKANSADFVVENISDSRELMRLNAQTGQMTLENGVDCLYVNAPGINADDISFTRPDDSTAKGLTFSTTSDPLQDWFLGQNQGEDDLVIKNDNGHVVFQVEKGLGISSFNRVAGTGGLNGRARMWGNFNYLNRWNNGSAGCGLVMAKSRGTDTVPLAILDEDVISETYGSGYNGSGFTAGSRILTKATENWSPGNTGGSYIVQTTDDGSSSLSQKMKIYTEGLMIGEDADGYTMPYLRGDENQVPKTDASGVVSWSNPTRFFQISWGGTVGTLQKRYIQFSGRANAGASGVGTSLNNLWFAPSACFIVGCSILRFNVNSDTVFEVEVETSPGSGVYTSSSLLTITAAENTQAKREWFALPIAVPDRCLVRVSVDGNLANPGDCLVQLFISEDDLDYSAAVLRTALNVSGLASEPNEGEQIIELQRAMNELTGLAF